MKKKIITGLVVLSIASVTAIAFGQPKHMKMGFGPGKHIMKVIKSLDLSDAQEDLLKELRAEKRSKQRAYRELMREKMEADVGTVFTKDGFNKTLFIEKATQGFEKRIGSMADFIEKAYDILDESQREIFIQEVSHRSLK